MSDERTQGITRQVQLDLLDHLRDLQKNAPRYIEEYVQTLVGPKTIRRPQAHMHPKLAELVRELALDAAVMDRRTCGAAGTPIRQGTGEPDLPRRKVV
jgi:hypothetical protein